MSGGEPILELRSVTKSYETGAPEPTRVLTGVNLTVRRGESLAIMGPSGSGKSTLLNILGTLDRPTSGEVRLDGEDVSRLDEAALARLRNRKLGFVFQLHHLLPQCSILENVLVPTLVGSGDAAAADRARTLLERVGLTHRLDHRPGQLSGGERQRVAVVRALINEPSLLLADEPTGSLDRSGSENLCRLLTELNAERGVTILMVTHSMRSARTMKRALELRDGVLAEPVAGLAGE
jgi:lipoprotein-releasing system ATP-binding protein